MLDTAMIKHGPVLIAYTNDVNQKREVLAATGAELLYLPALDSHVDLKALLLTLAQRGINEVLVEAGQGLNGAFLQANLIDEFIFYYAPKLMGTDAKGMFAIPELLEMQQAIDLQVLDVRQVGQDIRVRAKPAQI
jgi:diaminohydroxyphosphoribosylaminopyrimidine deaminase/5-amino-6-(5-phosphoribosylamino)uracil reductase